MKDVLKLTWIELFLRLIPESFFLVWGIYVLSRRCLNIRNCIFSSLVLSILTFFVRRLPIYFGVHMIINIILTISIVVISGVPIIKSIYSTLLMFFIFSLSEFINMIILNLVNIDTSFQFSGPVMKCMLGIPSLVVDLIFIITMNLLLKNNKKMKNVTS